MQGHIAAFDAVLAATAEDRRPGAALQDPPSKAAAVPVVLTCHAGTVLSPSKL